MFVSVILDLGNEDSEKVVESLLYRYSFKRVQKNAFESVSMNEKNLSRLKRDLDRSTDYYDAIRIYQYPVEGEMVITSLTQKRWRKSILKDKKSGGIKNA